MCSMFEYKASLFINTVFNSLQIFVEKCASCRPNWYNVVEMSVTTGKHKIWTGNFSSSVKCESFITAGT